jgi:leucyl/phenylalanyl-tRNA--protein transferase
MQGASRPVWLSAAEGPDAFPPAREALGEPNGLLAVGGSLSSDWLLSAYPKGIFPWYEEGQPILWWSPNPRAILRPEDLHVSRRLRRSRRRSRLRITADCAFDAVIRSCAAPRRHANATWITPQMCSAYLQMHTLGWAHSFEAWRDDDLVGGLYGLAIGSVFFGESMFSKVTDSSKLAFVDAVEYLQARGYELIDCQVWSGHLKSLGARMMPRDDFLAALGALCKPRRALGSWRDDFERYRHRRSARAPADGADK